MRHEYTEIQTLFICEDFLHVKNRFLFRIHFIQNNQFVYGRSLDAYIYA